jgi:hypothetical protein
LPRDRALGVVLKRGAQAKDELAQHRHQGTVLASQLDVATRTGIARESALRAVAVKSAHW